jgi:PST family polysaccharide transporter
MKNIINKFKNNSTILSNMASLGILQIANYIIPILVIPFIVRGLGVDKFGVVSYAQNIISYFTIIITYGFEYSATRKIAINKNNPNAVRTIFWNVIQCKIILLGIAFLLFTLLSYNFEKIQEDYKLYLILFSINIGFTLFPTWFFQGIENMKSMAIINFLIKVFGMGLCIFFVHTPEDYLIYAAMPSYSYAVFGAISFMYVIKRYNLSYTSNKTGMLNEVKNGFPIFLNSLFTTLYTTANITILGLYMDDYNVGIYSGAHKIIMAIMMVTSMPVNLAIFPSISRKMEKSKEIGVKYFKKMLLYVVLFSVVVGICCYIFSPIMVKIMLGEKFFSAIPLLKYFSVLPTLVIMASMFTVQGLYGLGYARYAPYVGISVGIICIASNIYLIPLYGIFGAATSWIIAQVMEITLSGGIVLIKTKI